MADTNTDDAGNSSKGNDAIFMMECLKHLQNPAAIDVHAVAAALGYKNSASVGNRIRTLKKKFDLQVTCTSGQSNQNGSPSTTPTPASRKGAKAARGPIKAKPEPSSANGSEPKPEKPKQKKTPGRKRKVKVEEKIPPEADLPSDDAKVEAPSTPKANGRSDSREDTEPLSSDE